MLWDKLQQAESRFLSEYPLGFNDPEMLKIGKKHKMDKMVETTQQAFAKTAFEDPLNVVADMVKVVSRSSMVSMFEKPKFRDFVGGLSVDEKKFLADSLNQFLHGKSQLGFESMVELLKTGKLAKWSLVSIIPAYFAPDKEVFVKPTTAKNVIQYFGIEEMVYKPQPTWEFYIAYRRLINQMKTKVDAGLSPSNAAFSGFLMMAMQTE